MAVKSSRISVNSAIWYQTGIEKGVIGYMDLSELTKRVNPRKGRTALVLEHYREIEAARKMLWEWNTIAESLGLGPKKGNALRMAFSYVTKKLDAGELTLPKQTTAKTTANDRQVGDKKTVPDIGVFDKFGGNKTLNF